MHTIVVVEFLRNSVPPPEATNAIQVRLKASSLSELSQHVRFNRFLIGVRGFHTSDEYECLE